MNNLNHAPNEFLKGKGTVYICGRGFGSSISSIVIQLMLAGIADNVIKDLCISMEEATFQELREHNIKYYYGCTDLSQ